jgi:hypothetical protein
MKLSTASTHSSLNFSCGAGGERRWAKDRDQAIMPNRENCPKTSQLDEFNTSRSQIILQITDQVVPGSSPGGSGSRRMSASNPSIPRVGLGCYPCLSYDFGKSRCLRRPS